MLHVSDDKMQSTERAVAQLRAYARYIDKHAENIVGDIDKPNYIIEGDIDDLRDLVRDALACVRESSRGFSTHPKTYRDLRSRAKKLGVDE